MCVYNYIQDVEEILPASPMFGIDQFGGSESLAVATLPQMLPGHEKHKGATHKESQKLACKRRCVGQNGCKKKPFLEQILEH